MLHDRPATRTEGLKLMESFIPRMGQGYAQGRNHDRGAGAHRDVSTLSPYVRRRLVTEQELVAAALRAHGADAAEKFIQEVFWRGYFKGWLERRPSVWTGYRHGLMDDLAVLDADARLSEQVAAAEAGTTGIACFDAWAKELVTTGYLHNHARMWFASIWIFTLGLPWRLGADFFYRHLLDGDPASNTLSWRWVGGLHTRGKAYEAKAWNIAKFTDGRFAPSEADLATHIIPLDKTEETEGLPDLRPLREPLAPDPTVPAILLITEEDTGIADFNLDAFDIRGVATLSGSHLRSPLPVAERVTQFEAEALADALRRSGREGEVLRAGRPDDLVHFAAHSDAGQVVMPYVPEGPMRDWLQLASPALATKGIALTEWRREWDSLIWPHATAGFFKVKKRIPQVLNALGME